MVCVVLGCGITGLTAAHELLKAGKEVVVLEKSGKVGGAIATYEINNGIKHYFIEAFYHHIFPSDINTLMLFQELGMNKNVEWLPTTTAFYCKERIHRLTKPADLLFYKPLSLKNKIIMAKLLLKIIREKNPLKYDNVSAKEWIIKNSNREIYESFFAGLLHGKFSSSSDETSAGWLIGRIQLRGKRNDRGEVLGYLWGGYQQLTNALVKSIREKGGKILINSSVNKINSTNGKVKDVIFRRNGKKRRIFCESVISTIPPKALLAVSKFPEGYKREADLPYQGALCVLLALKKRAHPYYWTNVLMNNNTFAAIIEHTNFVHPERYGEHLVYLASYPDYSSPYWKLPDKKVFDAYFKNLRKLFPHIATEDVNWWKVSRYPMAGLVYRKGIMSRVGGIGIKTPIKNLYACGMFNSLRERSVDESIKIANQTVKEVLKN